MVSLMEYQPSPSDIAWTENVLRIIRDGGVWGIPGTGQVYKVDHKEKTLTLIMDPGTPEADELHLKIIAVAKAMGWKVYD